MSHAPVFFAAPHRPLFFGGAVQALLTMGWWLALLLLRFSGTALALALPPSWLHGAMMIYGFFPFFIFGFALTAGPRWQGYDDISVRVYGPAFVVLAAGWALFYAGLVWPVLLAPGLALVLTGWFIVLREFFKVVRHPTPDRMHIGTVAMGLVFGAIGLAALLAQLSGGPVWLASAALTVGVWGFLLPIYFTVCHRMVPFFSMSALKGYKSVRPKWAFYVIVAAALGHGALTLANLPAWTWLVDLPAAVSALYLTHVWQWRRSLAVRILAMLHLGFLWLGVSLLLYATQSLALLAGHVILGLAPLHALSLGFFACTLLGMASRVSMGHSGRPVSADSLLWWLFVGLQGVTLTRVAAEIFSAAWSGLVLAAAIGWLAVFGIWVSRFAPFYWRPRIDGKEG